VAYLLEALSLPVMESRVFEIGGADQVSYADIMGEYARQRGLRRWMISIPVLTPRLSSLWLGLVTPVYARVGRKLVESLRYPTVVRDGSATPMFRVRPRGLREAMERALHNEDREFAQTRWSDALSAGAVRRRGVVCVLAPDSWIPEPFRSCVHPRRPSFRSGASEEPPGGTLQILCGDYEDSST